MPNKIIVTKDFLLENANQLPDNPGCWLWTYKKLSPTGYGKIGHEYVHRWSYRIFIGKIPDDLMVLHKCDVRSCINPTHLFLGTNKDNMRDKMKKGRHYSPGKTGQRKEFCLNGHKRELADLGYGGQCLQCRRK